jgi:hypothetical protein
MTGAVLLGFVTAGLGTALAQQTPPSQQPPQRERLLTPEDRAAMGQIFWHRVQATLGLNDQQVADIRAMLDQRREAGRADFLALRDSRRQLRTLLQQPIRAKLTPEQWQRWLEMRQGMGHRWMRRGRGAGMGPGMGQGMGMM